MYMYKRIYGKFFYKILSELFSRMQVPWPGLPRSPALTATTYMSDVRCGGGQVVLASGWLSKRKVQNRSPRDTDLELSRYYTRCSSTALLLPYSIYLPAIITLLNTGCRILDDITGMCLAHIIGSSLHTTPTPILTSTLSSHNWNKLLQRITETRTLRTLTYKLNKQNTTHPFTNPSTTT